MILFFRKLRQRFLAQNQVARYLAYALGEILLVVIGILIALQVNNWNEERQGRERFFFGLKQLYYQLHADTYGLQAARAKYAFHLSLIDQLQKAPESIDPANIPGMLQLLDDFTIFNTDFQQYLNYLELSPTDSLQNRMSMKLKQFANVVPGASNWNAAGYMYAHLREAHLPLSLKKPGMDSQGYLREPWEGFYSDADLEAARELIHSRAFLSDLKTYQGWKMQFLQSYDELYQSLLSILNDLETNYPQLKFGIQYMEVIGTGTPLDNWATGIPMERDPDNSKIWHLRTELRDGGIKFRTDPAWTFDWGYLPAEPGKAGFKGGNIPVQAGTYDITLDISKNTYQIEPVPSKHD